MEFSDAIIEQAWLRSDGKCECERATHKNWGKCNTLVIKSSRGDGHKILGWETHSKSGLYLNSPSDCEIFCWNCHKATS